MPTQFIESPQENLVSDKPRVFDLSGGDALRVGGRTSRKLPTQGTF